MFNTLADRERLLNYFATHVHDEYFSKHFGAVLGPIFVQSYFAVLKCNQNSPVAMGHGHIFQNFTQDREFDWGWSVAEMKVARQDLFYRLEQDSSFGEVWCKSYYDGFAEFDLVARSQEKISFDSLPNEEIITCLHTLIEAGAKQAHGYTVDCLLSSAGDHWFAEYAQKYLGRPITEDEVVLLREATHRTFVNQYHVRIVEAALALEQGKDITEMLSSIHHDYYWVENNYLRATPKTVAEILIEVKSIADPHAEYTKEQTRLAEIITKKKMWLDDMNASDLLRAFLKFSDECIFIQDCRKQAVLRLNHFIFSALDILAARLNFDPELIRYIMFYELEDCIKNPKKYEPIARERQAGCLILVDRDGMAIFSRDELTHLDLSDFFPDDSTIIEAVGTVASPGKVRGVARVILGSDQFGQFQKGDILITNQTTPDFVPLMKQAAAIIAEQGGITSHAAIVSRELGIPCLVGVKKAMSIFAGGGMVEVDAEKGIVRKI